MVVISPRFADELVNFIRSDPSLGDYKNLIIGKNTGTVFLKRTHQTVIREEALSDMYVINKVMVFQLTASMNLWTFNYFKDELEFSYSDPIFIKTTFPWILRPESQLLFSWECFFVFIVGVVAFLYPWQMMLHQRRTIPNYVFNCFVSLIYFVDFILKICTAVEDKEGRILYVI